MADIGIRVVVLGVAEARRNIGAVQSDINGLSSTISKVSGVTSNFGQALTRIGSALTGFGRTLTIGVTAPIAALGTALLESAIEFEDAFAGVTKTVDGLALGTGELTEDGRRLREEFVELSRTMPISAAQLASLGQIAGQFGQTKDTVLEMVEVLAMLQETTDIVSERQQQSFAQVVEIMGLAADEYDNLASSLVFLGNHFPTTEGRIISFTERIAGTAAALGISADAIVAWGAAVTASGIQAETGATALRKAFMEMALASKTAGDGVVDVSADIDQASDRIRDLEHSIAVTNQRMEEFTDSTRESTRMAADFSLERANDDLAEQQELLEGLNEIQGKVFSGGAAELQKFADTATLAFEASGLSVSGFAERFGILPGLLNDGTISAEEFSQMFRDNASSALQLFIDGLSQLDAVDQIALLDELGLGAQRVGSTLQNLAANTDLLDDALRGSAEAFRESIALQEEFNKRTSTVRAALQQLRNQFIALGVTIFNLVEDDLRRLIQGISDLIDRLIRMDPEMLKTILLIAGIAAAIGPLLILIGLAISSLGILVTGFAALISPVGLAIAAITGLGAAIAVAFAPQVVELIKNVVSAIREAQGFQFEGGGVTEAPQGRGGVRGGPDAGRLREQQFSEQELIPERGFLEAARSMIPPIPENVIESFNRAKAAIQALGVVLKDTGEAIIATIQETLGPTFQSIVDNLTETLHNLGLEWSDVWIFMKGAVIAVVSAIGILLLTLIAIVLGVVNGVAAGLSTLITYLDDAILFVKGFIDGVIDFAEGLGDTLLGIIHGDGQEFREGWGQLWLGLYQIVLNAGGLIVTAVVGIADTLVSLVAGMMEGIASFIANMFESITGGTHEGLELFIEGVQDIKERFSETAHSITTLVSTMINDIIDAFRNLYQTLVGGSIVPDMVKAIIDEIIILKDTVLGLAGDLVDGMIDKFERLAQVASEILGNLFSGGGESIDSVALEGIQTSIENIKLKLAELMAQLPIVTAAFVEMLFTPVTAGFILMITNMLMQWALFVATVTAELLILQLTWMITWLTMQVDTMSILASLTAAFSNFGKSVVEVINQINKSFREMLALVLDALNQMNHNFNITGAHALELSEEIKGAMHTATKAVQSLSNAFRDLAAAAAQAAAAVAVASADIANSVNSAQAAVTASPELKIQHSFERFYEFLNRTPFQFALDMGDANSLMASLSQATLPNSSVIDNSRSINVGDITTGTPVEDVEDIADVLINRMLAAGLI